MNLKVLSTSMVTAALLIGCGGGSDDKYIPSPGDNVEQNNLGWKKSSNNITPTATLVNDITQVVLSNTIGIPFIDQLTYKTYDLLKGKVSCRFGGTSTYRNNTLTLDKCADVFPDFTATGQIDVSSKEDTFTFRNLELTKANNEAVRINGVVKLSLGSSINVYNTDQLLIDARELIDTNTFDVIEYKVTAYTSTWNSLNSRELSMGIKGRLESLGNNEGDFNVSFDSTKTPLIHDLSASNSYYPFNGGLSIQDRTNSKNLIAIVANRDSTTFQYKVTENNAVLINRDERWGDFIFAE